HAYTRARAIPDRALVDVSAAAHDRPPGPADLQAIFWGGLTSGRGSQSSNSSRSLNAGASGMRPFGRASPEPSVVIPHHRSSHQSPEGGLPQRLAQPGVVAQGGDDLGRSLLRFKKPPDESLRVRSKRIGRTPRPVAHAQRLGVPQADGLV